MFASARAAAATVAAAAAAAAAAVHSPVATASSTCIGVGFSKRAFAAAASGSGEGISLVHSRQLSTWQPISGGRGDTAPLLTLVQMEKPSVLEFLEHRRAFPLAPLLITGAKP